MFRQSVRKQIAAHRSLTPTQRLLALCDLLDSLRAMTPDTPEAIERRTRVMAARQKQQEQFRARWRHWAAAERAGSAESL